MRSTFQWNTVTRLVSRLTGKEQGGGEGRRLSTVRGCGAAMTYIAGDMFISFTMQGTRYCCRVYCNC